VFPGYRRFAVPLRQGWLHQNQTGAIKAICRKNLSWVCS
jgi:hypothetical protein